MKHILKTAIIARNFLDEDSNGLCRDALSNIINYAAQNNKESPAIPQPTGTMPVTKPCTTCTAGPEEQCDKLCCHSTVLVDCYKPRKCSKVA